MLVDDSRFTYESVLILISTSKVLDPMLKPFPVSVCVCVSV